MSQTDLCYCCFVEAPISDLHRAEYEVELEGYSLESGTLVAYFWVCTACRRLGCDVPNPGGCKRPENDRGDIREEVLERLRDLLATPKESLLSPDQMCRHLHL